MELVGIIVVFLIFSDFANNPKGLPICTLSCATDLRQLQSYTSFCISLQTLGSICTALLNAASTEMHRFQTLNS